MKLPYILIISFKINKNIKSRQAQPLFNFTLIMIMIDETAQLTPG